ncbi:MAG TPA: hypothetical protein VMO76_08615 [Candidatus Udaeobacter sp.]|nr:hypothetical protein [Candidatus Udaeobacter sp.]
MAQTRLRLAEIWFADDLNLVCAAFASPTITDINSSVNSKENFAPLTATVRTPRLVQFALRYAF